MAYPPFRNGGINAGNYDKTLRHFYSALFFMLKFAVTFAGSDFT